MEKEKKSNKKIIVIILGILILFLIGILVFLLTRNKNDLSAIAIRIIREEGQVTLSDDVGKELSFVENMKLYSGNVLETATQSEAELSLDDTKFVTITQDSNVDFQKDGKKLALNLNAGELYFSVPEKLSDNEEFEITTSTMVVGIRGTSGVVDAENGEYYGITGTVVITGKNNVTGGTRTVEVGPGQKIHVYLFNDKEGEDSVDFVLEKYTPEEIPLVALKKLAFDKAYRDEFCEVTGISNEDVITEAIVKKILPENMELSEDEEAFANTVFNEMYPNGLPDDASNSASSEASDDAANSASSGASDDADAANSADSGASNDADAANSASSGASDDADAANSASSAPVAPASNSASSASSGGSTNASTAASSTVDTTTNTADSSSEGDSSDSSTTGSGSESESEETSTTKYSVTVKAGTGGSAEADKSKAKEGKTVTITADPDAGYKFNKWNVKAGDVTLKSESKKETTFVMGTKDVTVKATFEKKSYDITVNSADGGSAKASSSTGQIEDTITLTATPDSGYEFGGWTVVSGGVTLADASSATTTFTMGSKNVEVTPSFKKQYSVTVNSADGGSGSADPTTAVEGTTVTLSATANAGYQFFKWTVDAGGVSLSDASSASATFTMGSSNVTVTPSFEKITYNITVGTAEGGTAEADSSTGQMGDTIPIYAFPDQEYNFTSWTISGDGATLADASSAETSLTVGTADVTVTPAFEKKTYDITVNSADGGSGSASPNPASNGDTVTITASPSSEYKFISWTVDAGGVTLADSSTSPTTFTMGSDAVTITPTFALYPYYDEETGTLELSNGAVFEVTQQGQEAYYIEGISITFNNDSEQATETGNLTLNLSGGISSILGSEILSDGIYEDYLIDGTYLLIQDSNGNSYKAIKGTVMDGYVEGFTWE